MKKLIYIIFSVFCYFDALAVADSIKEFKSSDVIVTGDRIGNKSNVFSNENSRLEFQFNSNNIMLISRGNFLTKDIYLNGFKRSDIKLVIDGEHYHNACPNRMDSPLSRVNPLEMESFEVKENSSDLSTGIGGGVFYRRTKFGDSLKWQSYLTASALNKNDYDLITKLDFNNQRISLRFNTGQPYLNSEGKNYKELYGYKESKNYLLSDISYSFKFDEFESRLAFTYSEDISFPYLQMDERKNLVLSTAIQYGSNKVYMNYTDHIMDNNLRVSNLFMETKATNLTLGASGDFYEVFYRNWNSDNIFITPLDTINNKMIPGIHTFYGVVSYDKLISKFYLKAKAGISYELANEDINLKDYQKLFDDAKMSRYFPIAALTATFNDRFLQDFRYKLIAEIAGEPVQSEQLFIFVKKPKRPKQIPDWIGNPSLNQNIKSSFKTSLNYYDIEIGCGLTKIWDYVETGVMNYESLKYQTFKNIDAVIFNSYIKANWQYYDFYITYLWGENVHSKQPLSEIIPLTFIETFKIPEFYNLSIYLKHTYNNAQKRVNDELFENQSKAWNKIDLGINYRLNHFIFGVIAENITNELYSNHLSYLRNPFSTGMSVFEPGFSISFNVYYEM